MDMAWETIPLTDGGTLAAIGDPEVRPVGDHGVPAKMRYSHPGGANQPALDIGIEVRDGVPVCTEIRLVASDLGQVRVKDLTLLAGILEKRITELASLSVWDRTERGWGKASVIDELHRTAHERSVRNARQANRRRVTPDLLARVAEVYVAASGNRLEVIQKAFEVSERTAARYVTRAREAGLLDA